MIDKIIDDERVVTIKENDKIVMMMTYSVTNDPEKYLNNLDHVYIPHDPKGTVLVIENMVAARFGFRHVAIIKDFFYSKYPNIEKTMWRRRDYPKDRIITLRRRHEKQYSN